VSENAHGWSTEEVLGLLEQVDLFRGLPSDDLQGIAAIIDGLTIEADELLFEEGEPGDAFYIVFQGAVQISKERADGSQEKLAVRRKGEGFGEMALLNDAPRSATARATETTQLVTVSRESFQLLLGGDSLPLRMMQVLSKALRALGVRFASTEKIQDPGASVRTDAHGISRVMQAGLLPRTAPKMPGHDIAAGTTTEEEGRGGSVWDWIELSDGRKAVMSIDVTQDGFPPAYHLGTTRAVVRAVATGSSSVSDLLRQANEALSQAGIDGLDQFVQMGVLAVGDDGLEWGSAGKVPGGIIRRDGTFDEFGAHGPPLGMMGGFNYNVQKFALSAGDAAFVLSRGSQGLFLGAADLLAQLHGKPAGEMVSSLHKAIRKAQGDERSETSVLFVRKH
jgi:CRP-like cAMP-binding protein